MNSSIITTKNLIKSFGRIFALNGLELRVPKCIAGFIGRNGSGKTTTIGVLLGLLNPDQGEATVFGLDCWSDSFEIRRRVGVMHEVNSFPGSFTGKQYLSHVANLYGVNQVKNRVIATLNDVGLLAAQDKRIKTYSAGMSRRLGLAQALIGDPELVLLDEPTANIDPLGRVSFLDKIKELHREKGTSFLISTHVLSDLEKVCRWISIIDRGKIVDQGSVEDLAEKYSANIYKIEVSNPHLLVKKVQTLKTVKEAWIEDNKVYCKVKDPSMFYEVVPQVAAELKLQLKSFQLVQSTLEEIYTKTVGACEHAI